MQQGCHGFVLVCLKMLLMKDDSVKTHVLIWSLVSMDFICSVFSVVVLALA